MLSFVWMSNYPFLAGTGGSENYTAGHVRELARRGIRSRIITIGLGKNDGRDQFPDIEFFDVPSPEHLSKLDDTLVFVIYPHNVKTKRQSYVILHCPLSLCDSKDSYFSRADINGKKLITPSKFAAQLWGDYFEKPTGSIPVAYPFAENCFGEVKRRRRNSNAPLKVLFAGRLTPDKGIYTLLAALHMECLREHNLTFSATSACAHTDEGKVIHALLQAHPHITLLPSRRSPEDMAQLLAEHDIVVMPTTQKFWHEAFGILSVEAQHAGCRVVASHAGGLPETDCGSLITVEPDDPLALARGICHAASLGPVTAAERATARTKFTVRESVDSLLHILRLDTQISSIPETKASIKSV